jgi:AcrR family transcriptional regulator
LAKKDRDQTFWKVLNAALDLDFRKGHLKWTMSELSRKSAITRSLIYYHFGRSKLAILQEAVRVIGEELIGVDPERVQQWRTGNWKSSVLHARELLEQSPSLANFYMLHRARPTEIGESIRKLEDEYMKKLRLIFPHMNESAHHALFAFFFGVTFAPNINEEAVDFALRTLKSLTRKRTVAT